MVTARISRWIAVHGTSPSHRRSHGWSPPSTHTICAISIHLAVHGAIHWWPRGWSGVHSGRRGRASRWVGRERRNGRSLLIDNVAMVQKGVDGLDSRYSNTGLLRKFDRRSKIGFDFHRSLGCKVLIHDAICIRWFGHILNCLLLEIFAERTTLGLRNLKKLFDHIHDH